MSAIGTTAPASVSQRLLWLLDQFRGEQGATNCPIVLRLRGRLDTERLIGAVTQLTARHESLRTTFTGRGRRLAQQIQPPGPVAVLERRLPSSSDPDQTLRAAIEAEIREPVDAGRWPVRYTLWELGPDDHALCLNMHHLVTDGWSCGLVVRDLMALAAGTEPPPPVGWQFARFAHWQQEWLAGPEAEAERTYWRNKLSGASPLPIPLADGASRGRALGTGSCTATIDRQLVERLTRRCRAGRTTLPVALLAVYISVLAELTGQPDVCVSSFYSNRRRPELAQTVGLLANMVVLRTTIDPTGGLADVLARTHDTVMDAYVHQSTPYQLLPADTIDIGTRRPDDVVFQMVPEGPALGSIAGASAEAVLMDALGTRFECEMQVYPRGGELHPVLFYNSSRLDPAWAQTLIDRFVQMVTLMARDGTG